MKRFRWETIKNSKIIMRNSFFFRNHHGIEKEEKKYITDSIIKFIKNKII